MNKLFVLTAVLTVILTIHLGAQDGPLLYFPFDVGAGIDIIDATGNENNALMHNMDDTSWVDGKMGMALKFNGVDQYVKSTEPFVEPLEAEFTVALWFLATPDQDSRVFTLSMGEERLINIRCNENLIGIDDKGGLTNESSLYGDLEVTDGEWHHFALTRTEEFATLFLDGEWLVETGIAELVVMDNVTVGARSNDDGSVNKWFSGLIDEFMIYTRALSEEEIADMASGETSVQSDQPHVIKKYHLSQNYPNPFNPTTQISYAMPKAGYVTLTVYDVQGKVVDTLVNEQQTAGQHAVTWTADGLASGVYLYQLAVEGRVETKKLLLQK